MVANLAQAMGYSKLIAENCYYGAKEQFTADYFTQLIT